MKTLFIRHGMHILKLVDLKTTATRSHFVLFGVCEKTVSQEF